MPYRQDEPHPSPSPVAIGLHTTLKPTASGTLYLRVNDSAARSTITAARSTLRLKRYACGCSISRDVSRDLMQPKSIKPSALTLRLCL